jgi:hypothetical protein
VGRVFLGAREKPGAGVAQTAAFAVCGFSSAIDPKTADLKNGGLHCKPVKSCFFSKLFSVASVLQRSNTEVAESLSNLRVKVLNHRDREEYRFGCGREAALRYPLDGLVATARVFVPWALP